MWWEIHKKYTQHTALKYERGQIVWISYHIHYMRMILLLYVFSCDFQGHVVLWIPYHILCMNMVSLLCVCFMWLWRWQVCVNLSSHKLHEYSFSPVCVVMWHLVVSASLNLLSHTLHKNGFSPVCVFMWFASLCEFCITHLERVWFISWIICAFMWHLRLTASTNLL